MKRSRTVSLVVMGLTPLVISACDDTKKSRQEFHSVQACEQAGVPSDTCQSAYDKAQAQALIDAPRFNDLQSCAAQYEQNTCTEQDEANGSAYWMPGMNGFLIARIVRNGITAYLPGGPVLRKSNLADYSPRFGGVYAYGGANGWTSVPSDEIAGEGDTVSRGGFGGEGEGFGG